MLEDGALVYPVAMRVPVLTVFLICFGAMGTSAHDSLYNYIEVRINPDSEIRIDFSVHGPELAITYGVDPLTTDTSWLDVLSPDQAKKLLDDAGSFILKTFQVCSADENLLTASDLFLPTLPEVKESWKMSEGARPGSFVGTLLLPTSLESVTFQYGKADKRLMLVVTRPGSFPKVYDIGPEQSQKIDLSTE